MLNIANLRVLGVPEEVSTRICKIITRMRQLALKTYNNGNSKTSFFNHHHYNLLFLKITPASFSSLTEEDLQMHSSIFRVDILQQSLTESQKADIVFANIIKQYVFAVIEKSMKENL